MKTTLYITRHGQTLWNVEKRMQGWKDSPLTENGLNQAMLLHERLKDTEFDVIYASSCKRAFKTAEIVRGERSIPLIPDDNLREINMGKWEGMRDEEIKKLYSEEYYNFWHAADKCHIDGGESFITAQKRFVTEINDILSRYEGKTVLVVAHACVLKLMLCYFGKRPVSAVWDPPFAHPTCLSIVEFEEGNAKIVMELDTSHYNISEVG